MKIQSAPLKGFTLIEIMIVVVIIGLLAAMAYPAYRKVAESSANRACDNDARQIASAAQQYILENAGVTTVSVGVISSSGMLTGMLSTYVRKISRGTQPGSFDSTLTPAFTMSFPVLGTTSTAIYDGEGKRI